MSQPLRYDKPLSLQDRLLIDLVTARFEGVDSQWVAFDREDHVELRCPETIRTSPARLAQLKAQSNETRNVQAEETQVLLGTPISRGA